MNLSANPQLLELLAASHALGSLRGGARRRFESIAREQPPVRAAALAWQSRLASMAELQAPLVPDPAVWIRIRNLIEAEQQQRVIARQRASLQVATPSGRGWQSSLALWRGAAGAAALVACLAVVIGVNLDAQLRSAPAVRYVAVLSDDKSTASMLVTFDPKHRQLVLQRLGDYREGSDKSLQLWALPPDGVPRSLGVLSDAPALKLTATDADVRAVPALAITLEPKGGVPGGPTGPVLFKGALIEKML